jgi:hypothetical protein
VDKEKAKAKTAELRGKGWDDQLIASKLAEVDPEFSKMLSEGLPATSAIDNYFGVARQDFATKEQVIKDIAVKEDPSYEDVSAGRIVAALAADVAISEGMKAAGTAAGAKTALALGQAGPQVAAPEEVVTVPAAATVGYVSGSIAGGISGSIAAQKIERPDKPISIGRVISDTMLNVLPGTELRRGPKILKQASKQLAKRPVRAQMAMGAVTGPSAIALEGLIETGELPPGQQLMLASGTSSVLGGGLGYTSTKATGLLKRVTGKTSRQINDGIARGDKDMIDYVNGMTALLDPKERANLASPKEVLDYIKRTTLQPIAPSKVLGPKATKTIRDAANAVTSGEETGAVLGMRIKKEIDRQSDPALANEFAEKFLLGQTSTPPKGMEKLAEYLGESRKYIREYQEELLQNHYDGQRLLPDYLVEQIEKSLNDGDYLTRAYRFFDDPSYTPSPKQYQSAIKRLTQEGLTDEQVESRVRKFTAKYKAPSWEVEALRRRYGIKPGADGKGNSAFQRDLRSIQIPTKKRIEQFRQKLQSERMSKVEAEQYLAELNSKRSNAETLQEYAMSKNSGILTEKKDLAPEIRDYLGEYVEPGQRVAATMSKMARLNAYDTADKVLAQQLAEAGIAKSAGFGQDWVPLNLRRGNASINEEKLFVPPEVQAAVNQLYGADVSGRTHNKILEFINDAWDAQTSVSKAAKVVANPPSYMVQVFGNVINLAGMGMNPVKGLKQGLRMGRAQFAGGKFLDVFSGLDSKESIAMFKDYKKRGLLPGGVTYEDMKSGLRGGFGDIANKAVAPLGKAYSIADIAGRVVAYENYSQQLRKFAPGADETKLRDIAQELTNHTYQNYDYLNKTARALSRKGVMPQFASFTLELMRNQYHQGRLIKEMLSGKFADQLEQELGVAVNRKAIQAEGAKRLVALSAVYGSLEGGRQLFNSQSLSDEEMQAIRETVLPEWDKQQSVAVRRNGEEVGYMNTSYIAPHDTLFGMFNAGLRGDSFQEKFSNATEALADQFVGEGSFVFRAAAEAVQNKDDKGKQISTSPDLWGQLEDRLEYYAKEVYTPGIAREIKKAKSGQSVATTVARQAGLRWNTSTIPDGFRYKAQSFNETQDAIRKNLARAAFSEMDQLGRTKTREELGLEYTVLNENHKANMQSLVKHVKNLRILGYDDNALVDMMVNSKVSSDSAYSALRGEIDDLEVLGKESVSDVYERILDEPGRRIEDKIYTVAESDPFLGKKLAEHHKRVVKDRVLNINSVDRLLRGMDVDKQVKFITRDMERSNNPQAVLDNYYARKIIGKEAYYNLMKTIGK